MTQCQATCRWRRRWRMFRSLEIRPKTWKRQGGGDRAQRNTLLSAHVDTGWRRTKADVAVG